MSLRQAILALLDVEPGTGYDLMGRFRRSVGFFWHANHQQVYKELHAMLEEGLVTCEEQVQSGRPSRKVYSLAAEGAKTLDAWLQAGTAPMKVRDPLLVTMFAGHRLPPAQLAAELARHRADHERTLATYHEIEAVIDALPPRHKLRYRYPRQTLRMGIHYEQAWLAWHDETVIALDLPAPAAQAPTASAATPPAAAKKRPPRRQ